MASSLSASMPSSRAFAAHFATVALLQPSELAASFQLTPFSSCRMISFFVAMPPPPPGSEGARAAPSLPGRVSGDTAVPCTRNDGIN